MFAARRVGALSGLLVLVGLSIACGLTSLALHQDLGFVADEPEPTCGGEDELARSEALRGLFASEGLSRALAPASDSRRLSGLITCPTV